MARGGAALVRVTSQIWCNSGLGVGSGHPAHDFDAWAGDAVAWRSANASIRQWTMSAAAWPGSTSMSSKQAQNSSFDRWRILLAFDFDRTASRNLRQATYYAGDEMPPSIIPSMRRPLRVSVTPWEQPQSWFC